MSDATLILGRMEGGDPSAARQLMPLVYEELRKLAAARPSDERPDHTLQATALVNEGLLAAGRFRSKMGEPRPLLCRCRQLDAAEPGRRHFQETP
jgi:hypothetical protein